MIVIGVDPGAGGAFAVYDGVSSALLSVEDTPHWFEKVGKTQRKRVDIPGLLDALGTVQLLCGAEALVTEKVNGWGGQGASGAFEFGWAAAAVYTSALALGLQVVVTPPAEWKFHMKVPGKRASVKNAGVTKKQIDAQIVKRADDLFPGHHAEWRGPKGGLRLDRAEAAMLARYGAESLSGRFR